jgi:hypothetical protein
MSDKLVRMNDTKELNNETVVKEVEYLMNEKKNIPEMLNYLRGKYTDDNIIDAVLNQFNEKREKSIKMADIFLDAFKRKYGEGVDKMSLSRFMKKALKYKKKYELSDDDFDEIRRRFEMKIFNTEVSLGATGSVVYPNTNLSRALGYPVAELTSGIKPASSDEYTYLQDILKMFQMFRSLHSYIVIQTMSYKDLAFEAMSGMFDRNKHDVNRHVHPVLAALFLPKIPFIEERMLYSNIAGIINSRYNKERIVIKPDYELFYSMVVDPTDIVCDNSSPIKDLKSRAEVQVQLWNNVYNLRNGKYYDATSIDFIAYIDKCKISNVDNPDIMYLSDEGVILRRLFSIFSFRPLIVSTQPVFGVITNNPFNLPVNTNVITSIPYITYRLPNAVVQGVEYKLSDANSQVQFYMENGTFVPKMTQLIDCRGPIVYYVPRRFIGLPMQILYPQITPFSNLNLHTSTRHYNKINTLEINYDTSIELSVSVTDQIVQFYLRSVVAFERYEDTSIILGHMTFLYGYPKDDQGNVLNATPNTAKVYAPSQALKEDHSFHPIINPPEEESMMKSHIKMFGTIFVYSHN